MKNKNQNQNQNQNQNSSGSADGQSDEANRTPELKAGATDQSQDSGGEQSGQKSNVATKSDVAGAIPDAFYAVKKLKDRGGKIWSDVQTLASETADALPEGARTKLQSAQTRVVSKMRDNRGVSTAIIGTLAAIGAAIVADRLLRVATSELGAGKGDTQGSSKTAQSGQGREKGDQLIGRAGQGQQGSRNGSSVRAQ